MHLLALGAFCQEMAEFLNENLWGVLMHLLALGAFCQEIYLFEYNFFGES